MSNTVNLLVIAIVAAAVLALFWGSFESLFYPKTDPLPKLSQGVTSAKASVGQAVSVGTFVYSNVAAITSNAFSSRDTDVFFECNSPQICCSKFSQCTEKINWNPSGIVFDEKTKTPTYVRCEERFDFFACKIFFGLNPAQLKIESVAFPGDSQAALHSSFKIDAAVKNTGELASLSGTAILTISKRRQDQTLEALPHLTQQIELPALEPRALIELSFSSLSLEVGTYEFTITVQSDNAGFDSQTRVLASSGSIVSACRPMETQPLVTVWDSENNECITKYACSNCQLALECVQEWQKIRPETVFETGDYTYAQTVQVTTQANCQ